ncbi:MAG TPA: flagellar filament capping protein FliD [Nocardioides sp.]|nr:flagellar filament capping protein FliD [Nocardioides sp.]
MANASIGGLSSGLDTAGIIDALMTLEAAPQQRLRTRVTDEQSVVTKLQAINTRTSLVASRAETLAKASTWAGLTATSTSSAVTATASGTATPGRLTVTVTSTAATHQLGFAESHALTDVVTGAGTTVRITRPSGAPLDIDTGDGTLAGLVAAINDPENETGLHAQTVRVGTGQYRLLVESVETGAAQAFDLTRLDGQPLLGGATTRPGTDATVDLGAGITASSSTNTFTDLLPGVTVTVAPGTAPGTVATVTVARDAAAISTKVEDLVAGVNAVLSEIKAQTAFNASTKRSGPLSGEASVRELRSNLLNAVFPPDDTSLAQVGIELDRAGNLTFDAERFAEAYADDPAAVAAMFTGSDGFAGRMQEVADAASDPIDGTITGTIAGRTSSITRLESGIEDWDRRLELRRSSLERQYAALEVALSQLSSQSSWLTSQLAGLTQSQQ